MTLSNLLHNSASRLLVLLLALPAMLSLTSCSDDDGMDSSLSLFQEYFVLIQDGEKAGYANFRLGTAAGPRVELTNGSKVECNALEMVYFDIISENDPLYNYVSTIAANHKKAIFTFIRSKNKTYTNTIDFDVCPDIAIPSVLNIRNGETIQLNMGEDFDINEVHNINASFSNGTITYDLTVTPAGVIHVDNIPAGYYKLTAEVSATMPTQENDGTAKGSITLTKRVTRAGISVN